MALKLPDSAVPMGDFPVAKAVDIDFDDGENLQDKFDNGELGTVTGITNVKTYCLLSQLGITTPCTIKDIWDKMSSGSITIIDADSSIVTDLDVIRIALGISDDDEVYGILTVVKLEQRTTLEFRRARTGKSLIPDTFIGYCKGSDCTSINWEKLRATSVDDVSKVVKKIYIKDVSSEDARTLIQNHWSEFDEFEFYNLHLDTAKWAWNAEIYAHTQEYGTVLLMSYGSDVSSVFYGKLYDGVWTWKEIATVDNAKDVDVTTITPVDSTITGTIEYTVKNGICYVSMTDLKSTINSIDSLISTTMPKPSVNCSAASINTTGIVARIYIDKNTAKLNGNFYEKNAKSYCSFSYPVAE